MASTPIAQPTANAMSTMMTIGACHSCPKTQRTVASCWLFNAKANSAKKMKARKSQTTRRMLEEDAGLFGEAHIAQRCDAGAKEPGEEAHAVDCRWATKEKARLERALNSQLRCVLRRRILHHRHVRIDRLAQGLARLKVRHQLLGDHHLLAAARVAPDARRPAVDREAPEATDLDAVPARERVRHRIENGLHRELSVAVGELAESLGQLRHEIRPRHGRRRITSRPSACPAWRAAAHQGWSCRRSRARC